MELKKNLAVNMRVRKVLWKGNMEDFSSELGVCANTIKKVLKEDGNTTLATVEQMAERLGVPAVSLLRGEYDEHELYIALCLLHKLEMFSFMEEGKQQEIAEAFHNAVKWFSRLFCLLEEKGE